MKAEGSTACNTWELGIRGSRKSTGGCKTCLPPTLARGELKHECDCADTELLDWHIE